MTTLMVTSTGFDLLGPSSVLSELVSELVSALAAVDSSLLELELEPPQAANTNADKPTASNTNTTTLLRRFSITVPPCGSTFPGGVPAPRFLTLRL
ncbi:MAG: hypothetical protein QM729_07855 [Solirubrobacterales bacterium]